MKLQPRPVPCLALAQRMLFFCMVKRDTPPKITPPAHPPGTSTKLAPAPLRAGRRSSGVADNQQQRARACKTTLANTANSARAHPTARTTGSRAPARRRPWRRPARRARRLSAAASAPPAAPACRTAPCAARSRAAHASLSRQPAMRKRQTPVAPCWPPMAPQTPGQHHSWNVCMHAYYTRSRQPRQALLSAVMQHAHVPSGKSRARHACAHAVRMRCPAE